MTGPIFDEVAEDYARSRPPYPAAVYDILLAAVGRPWPELTVVDVGAGTGIATEQFAARGARVVAVDPARQMLDQLRRMLPGTWNVPDFDVPWVADQARRLRTAAPRYHGFAGADIGLKLSEPPFDLPAQHHQIRWARRVTTERHVTMLGTHSYLAALDPVSRHEFLDSEHDLLAQAFPVGILDEPYVTTLTTVRRP
jgi:trans-aconitate methyltransferase